MCGERGQATIEWTAAVLLVALSLGGLVAIAPRVDGRSFGGWLAHRIACAVRGDCGREDDALRAAYGERDAALVRAYAPGIVYEPGTLTLPVDFRRCRSHRCSDAPDDRDLDVHRGGRGGTPATAFTHVVRDGGEAFLQYWLYYPDSTTTVGNLAGAWNRVARLFRSGRPYPGSHQDDWESYMVRIDRRGRAWARSSSHKGYQSCKYRRCRDRWMPVTGWTRVSRGSHAGHIPVRARRRILPRRGHPGLRASLEIEGPAYPGVDLRERTTTAPSLRLVPLESVDRGAYVPRDGDIKPPWRKDVYEDPRSDSTS